MEPLWEEVSIKDRIPLGRWWVITGGESEQRSGTPRPYDLAWARKLRDECSELGIPFFLKQLGSAPVNDGRSLKLELDLTMVGIGMSGRRT